MKYKHLILLSLSFVLLTVGQAAENRLGVQAKGRSEYMFVSGDGQKEWYSALELEQIAKAYVTSKNVEFEMQGTQPSIWIHTDGGKVLAEVWFTSGAGRPSLQVSISRKGAALKHKIVEPAAAGEKKK